MKRRDLTGAKFGKLLVLSAAENKGRFTQWNCRCDCGNTVVVATSHLTNGHTKSCGCLRSISASKNFVKHHQSDTRLYRIWRNMKTRCENPNSDHYYLYGGRGISICSAWRDDYSAFAEWALTHGYNDDLSIDRIDVDGPYSPDNCRFATMKEQANNTRVNHRVFYNGAQRTISELSDEFGVSYDTLLSRINVQNWDIKRAISTPIQSHRMKGGE